MPKMVCVVAGCSTPLSPSYSASTTTKAFHALQAAQLGTSTDVSDTMAIVSNGLCPLASAPNAPGQNPQPSQYCLAARTSCRQSLLLSPQQHLHQAAPVFHLVYNEYDHKSMMFCSVCNRTCSPLRMDVAQAVSLCTPVSELTAAGAACFSCRDCVASEKLLLKKMRSGLR